MPICVAQSMLRLGFGGIREEARRRLGTESDPEKRDWLSGVCIAYEGASVLARRYADLAAAMAERASGARADELARIHARIEQLAPCPKPGEY